MLLTSYLIETPEEKADEFVKELKEDTIAADLPKDQKSALQNFIQFPEKKKLEQTRMVINQAENVDNSYHVKVRFQAYEYKDESSEVIESYDGMLVIKMKKTGFREWDILDVTINPYKEETVQ
ncbi:hypothetical protein [Pseudalkalibacillus decolorationis]|uniref:hypothetical protein n=1 Tax=Pseudalkalibacillus decolorationis TaxID=163879 RepID=UPI00214918C5|nr:hypothetical protein [Pseudalkalibacillus decolorationis]